MSKKADVQFHPLISLSLPLSPSLPLSSPYLTGYKGLGGGGVVDLVISEKSVVG